MTDEELEVARKLAATAASKYVMWLQTKPPREISYEEIESRILAVFTLDVVRYFFELHLAPKPTLEALMKRVKDVGEELEGGR
jgi:hypothetical protein